jgi:mannitol-1-/sugar-/sorbitol-6-phosphatase
MRQDAGMEIRVDDGGVRTVRGVLFDMDGTIVDSGPATERTWRQWAERMGVGNRLEILHGQPAIETVRALFPDASTDELAELCADQTVAEREDLDGVVAMPGAQELFEFLEAHEIAWAVVTSADRLLAEARLGAAGITPPVLVTCDDITFGKPHPEPFLLGASRIGIDIRECVVAEDAPAGVQAGMASGAVTAALNGHAATVGIRDLRHLRDLLTP